MNARVEKILSGVKGTVKTEVRYAVRRIYDLAVEYKSRGKDFTFSSFPELDRLVNEQLIHLSDEVLEDVLRKLKLALEEIDMEYAYDEIAKEVEEDDRFGILPIVRIDSHSSHLKSIIEGMLAIGFAYGLTRVNVIANIMNYIDNPNAYSLWKDAVRSGEFAAEILSEEGIHFGKGILRNPIEGLTLTEQTMIQNGFERGVVQGYRSLGAIGYRVYRTTDYYCPDCDALCVGIHPLNEVVLPAHPRCKCATKPVYPSDLED